jgi:AcrR family transcriptional regulator
MSAASASAVSPSPRASREPGRAFLKGQQTRAAIVDAALLLASRNGLEGLSIGTVAEAAGMSKSGVFAHFGSREELQISVVREYHNRFEAEVFRPALSEPRGLPRLKAMFKLWLQRVSVEIEAGCIYISGAVEFDDRPGPVRDALADMVRAWHEALHRAIEQAVEEGHLAPGTDAAQLLFEIHGLVLSVHHDARFLKYPGTIERALRGFDRVIQTALPRTLPQATAPKARASSSPRR